MKHGAGRVKSTSTTPLLGKDVRTNILIMDVPSEVIYLFWAPGFGV